MGTPDTSSSNSLLEIKVILAKDIWSFNFFQKLTLYAVASLSADRDQKKQLSRDQTQEQRTPTDPDGDGHPEWNHPITFDLSPFPLYPSDSDSNSLPARTHLLLRFELRHQIGIPLIPDKLVGEVIVPLSDLLDGSSSPNISRFVDYQVKSPDGKGNGVLRFSYKVPADRATYDPSGLDLGISGYTVNSDQIQPNFSEKPPGIYPPIESVPQVNEEGNLIGQSQYPPNSSYQSAPAVYPPIEEDYTASPTHYPPRPSSPMWGPPSEGFWTPPHPPPPPPHHLHHRPPPPRPFFHYPPPPPPGSPGHWGRPPGSQQYYDGCYEHARGY